MAVDANIHGVDPERYDEEVSRLPGIPEFYQDLARVFIDTYESR